MTHDALWYGEVAAKFGMAEGSFGRETGTVLYHLTFYRSEN